MRRIRKSRNLLCKKCQKSLIPGVTITEGRFYGGWNACAECSKVLDRESDIRTGRRLDPNGAQAQLIQMLRKLIVQFRKEAKKYKRALERDRKELKTYRRYRAAFYQKIWQPCICADCGTQFETLRPIEWVALGYINGGVSIQRCRPCSKIHRLQNHGGGARRRCKQFKVPYKVFNPRVIFIRDCWKCQLCGIDTPESLRGSYELNAPELDHIWPLSVKRGKRKSPGHVEKNCRLLCRGCNGGRPIE